MQTTEQSILDAMQYAAAFSSIRTAASSALRGKQRWCHPYMVCFKTVIAAIAKQMDEGTFALEDRFAVVDRGAAFRNAALFENGYRSSQVGQCAGILIGLHRRDTGILRRLSRPILHAVGIRHLRVPSFFLPLTLMTRCDITDTVDVATRH
jgi:hypothetical protein